LIEQGHCLIGENGYGRGVCSPRSAAFRSCFTKLSRSKYSGKVLNSRREILRNPNARLPRIAHIGGQEKWPHCWGHVQEVTMGGQCQERRCKTPPPSEERRSGKYRGMVKRVIVLEFAASLVIDKVACAAPKHAAIFAGAQWPS
jgi:hypothetical protein